MVLRALRVPAMAILIVACDASEEPRTTEERPVEDTATVATAIDSAIPPAVAGEEGWNFVQRATADLDGDGSAEEIVLTARVELYRGRPAWDDGQPWQVYVETADSARTYLYAQRLQLGTLDMRVTLPDSSGASSVVLLEHLPDRLTIYEARWRGADSARVLVRLQRLLDPRGQVAAPRLP